ncbi:SH3-like domain-containing protein [uncultured Methylobacterium sp.]|uniref:SH3-like domain-containing protein n=1 Tax=uncultured Methylobacterium sp. TaxID=157278 RepID=UPI0035CB14AB
MARFQVGQRVRVLDLGKLGHVRTPYYVRGRTGTVVQLCGLFLNPEDLAVGNAGGRVVACYRVEFRQGDLWADYDGAPGDTLVIELYEHWIDAAAETAHG